MAVSAATTAGRGDNVSDIYSVYPECPNCRNRRERALITKCPDCRELFCTNCDKIERGMMGHRCPYCSEFNYTQVAIGKVQRRSLRVEPARPGLSPRFLPMDSVCNFASASSTD